GQSSFRPPRIGPGSPSGSSRASVVFSVDWASAEKAWNAPASDSDVAECSSRSNQASKAAPRSFRCTDSRLSRVPKRSKRTARRIGSHPSYARAVFIVDGLENAFRMAWGVWGALVLGFMLSGIVQAWVPRARLERALGGVGARQVALSAGLGAASSSCSYAAVAIAKSLFQKGASFASAMVFQFASTNLVFELG